MQQGLCVRYNFAPNVHVYTGLIQACISSKKVALLEEVQEGSTTDEDGKQSPLTPSDSSGGKTVQAKDENGAKGSSQGEDLGKKM